MRYHHLHVSAACFLFLATCGITQSAPNLTGHVPMSFEPNQGQIALGMSYLVHQHSYRIAINETAITYRITSSSTSDRQTFQLHWAGDHRTARFEPSGLLPGKSNYFIGNDPSRWITDVPHYQELKEIDARPGVDLRYHSSPTGDLEYDILVAPNTDLAGVRFTVEGADKVSIDPDGALVLKAGSAQLRQLPAQAYELQGDRKVPVEASYVLTQPNQIAFSIRGRNPQDPLVIDPVLVYSTLLGVTDTTLNYNDEAGPVSWGLSSATDPAKNFYITGLTEASDFPITPGSLPVRCPPVEENPIACNYVPLGFVSKFSSSGELLYSTYFGGTNGIDGGFNHPVGKTLAVDQDGYAYVVGTASNDFPTTSNGFQPTCKSGCAFLIKLNQNGSALAYSTFLGGSAGTTSASGLALWSADEVYMVGSTDDLTLPTTSGGYQHACSPTSNGLCSSGFVARFDTSAIGSKSRIFTTYLGPTAGQSIANAIAVDKYGDAYIVGNTTVDLPSIATFGSGTAPACNLYDGNGNPLQNCETYTVKLKGSNGSALRGATLMRGVSGYGIVVDSSLNTIVAGAASNGLATVSGGFQTTFGGGNMDGFVTKLDLSGYTQLFSTFLGGSGDDMVTDIAVNNNGMPFVTGLTSSQNFPIVKGAFKSTLYAMTENGFVTAINADGKSLYYSSYLGGSLDTEPHGIALDSAWNAIVAGTTNDGDFPLTPNALPIPYESFSDAFLSKIVIAGDLGASLTTSVSTVPTNGHVIYHARLTNYGPDGSDKVVFKDSIPAGMAYVGVNVPNGNGCTQPKVGATSGTLTCNKTRLESGDTWYVNVYLKAVGKSGSQITNTVNVSAKTQDLWQSNNTASATIQIQ